MEPHLTCTFQQHADPGTHHMHAAWNEKDFPSMTPFARHDRSPAFRRLDWRDDGWTVVRRQRFKPLHLTLYPLIFMHL
jgi:hypothetical protein